MLIVHCIWQSEFGIALEQRGGTARAQVGTLLFHPPPPAWGSGISAYCRVCWDRAPRGLPCPCPALPGAPFWCSLPSCLNLPTVLPLSSSFAKLTSSLRLLITRGWSQDSDPTCRSWREGSPGHRAQSLFCFTDETSNPEKRSSRLTGQCQTQELGHGEPPSSSCSPWGLVLQGQLLLPEL